MLAAVGDDIQVKRLNYYLAFKPSRTSLASRFCPKGRLTGFFEDCE